MLLRDRADGGDVLRGAFHAHLLLHCLDTARSAASAETASTGVGLAPGEADRAEHASSDPKLSKQSEASSTVSITADAVFREPHSTAAGQLPKGNPAAWQAGSVEGRRGVQPGPDGGVGADMLRSIRTQADAACTEYLMACAELGWDLGQTMLNPHEPRLVDYVL